MSNRDRLALTLILGVAAAIRLVVMFQGVPALTHDSYVYMRHAAAIRAADWANAVPNGYPLLLAAIPFEIGSSSFIRTAQLLNVLFALSTTMLAFATARRFHYGSRAALVASALVALWPHQVNYSRLVLTECTTAFLIALAVWASVASRGAVCGLALAAAALVRTTALPLVPAMPPLTLSTWRETTHALAVAATTIVAFVAVAVFSSGHAGLGTNLPMNLEIARMSEDGNYRFDIQGLTLEAALEAYVWEAAASPVRFAKQRVQSLNELWGPWPIENGRPAASRLVIGLRFPAVLLALAGWWRLPSRRARWAMALPLAAITLVHVALFSMARFSQPVEPQVLLLAVGAFAGRAGRTSPPR